MRRLLISAALLLAMALLVMPSAFAQFGGYGPPGFGGYGPQGYGSYGNQGFGGYGASPYGAAGGPFGGFGSAQTPYGFGSGPGGPPQNLQVCTDSQGNKVLVSNSGSATTYTGCTTAASAGSPPTNVTQVCTDSLGNRVLVLSGNATTGYTN